MSGAASVNRNRASVTLRVGLAAPERDRLAGNSLDRIVGIDMPMTSPPPPVACKARIFIGRHHREPRRRSRRCAPGVHGAAPQPAISLGLADVAPFHQQRLRLIDKPTL